MPLECHAHSECDGGGAARNRVQALDAVVDDHLLEGALDPRELPGGYALLVDVELLLVGVDRLPPDRVQSRDRQDRRALLVPDMEQRPLDHLEVVGVPAWVDRLGVGEDREVVTEAPAHQVAALAARVALEDLSAGEEGVRSGCVHQFRSPGAGPAERDLVRQDSECELAEGVAVLGEEVEQVTEPAQVVRVERVEFPVEALKLLPVSSESPRPVESAERVRVTSRIAALVKVPHRLAVAPADRCTQRELEAEGGARPPVDMRVDASTAAFVGVLGPVVLDAVDCLEARAPGLPLLHLGERRRVRGARVLEVGALDCAAGVARRGTQARAGRFLEQLHPHVGAAALQ